jgi:hypothetical protein
MKRFLVMPANGGAPYFVEADEARPATNFYAGGELVHSVSDAGYREEPAHVETPYADAATLETGQG